MIPAWLLNTHAGPNHRTATLHPCKQCNQPILTGLDADTAALTAKTDPTPLTPLGETIALLQNRATYNLTTTDNGKKKLDHRDQWHITMPRQHPVLPEHQCGQPLTEYAENIRPRKTKRYVTPNECPY
jgi:hypothetical protein